MERKYEMRICNCGRIHMIPLTKIDRAFDNDKELLVVCGGCGKATYIGSNKEPDIYDPNNDTVYVMYSGELQMNEDGMLSVSADSFKNTKQNKGFSEILFSGGLRVPMNTGNYANHYWDGTFADMTYPDFYKIQRNDMTVEGIMSFIKKFHEYRRMVNMNRFMDIVPEDMLEEISCYWIKAFDWKGTPYEKEWS